MSINRVVITGNLTRDPELRSTAGGMSILKMGVAVNDRRKNQETGEWEEVPNFVDVVLFGTRADRLSQYLSKGQKVAVEGKLRWSSWEDKSTGDKRSKIEVVADDIEFMSSRGEGGGYSAPASSAPVTSSDPSAVDEDIPF